MQTFTEWLQEAMTPEEESKLARRMIRGSRGQRLAPKVGSESRGKWNQYMDDLDHEIKVQKRKVEMLVRKREDLAKKLGMGETYHGRKMRWPRPDLDARIQARAEREEAQHVQARQAAYDRATGS